MCMLFSYIFRWVIPIRIGISKYSIEWRFFKSTEGKTQSETDGQNKTYGASCFRFTISTSNSVTAVTSRNHPVHDIEMIFVTHSVKCEAPFDSHMCFAMIGQWWKWQRAHCFSHSLVSIYVPYFFKFSFRFRWNVKNVCTTIMTMICEIFRFICVSMLTRLWSLMYHLPICLHQNHIKYIFTFHMEQMRILHPPTNCKRHLNVIYAS